MSAKETDLPPGPAPSQAAVHVAQVSSPPVGAGGSVPGGGGPGEGGSALGVPLPAFIAAVGRSVAVAAQDLRAMPAPSGALGVELRNASLTIKAVVSWDAAGTLRLQPAAPGDTETAISQLLLNYEPVPRLPASGPAGMR